ncbi:MAG: tetratricopeptide repeat protein [Myxococcota bacterium]
MRTKLGLALAVLGAVCGSAAAGSVPRWPDSACSAGTSFACVVAAQRELADGRSAQGSELLWRAWELDDAAAWPVVQQLVDARLTGTFPWAAHAATASRGCETGDARACLSLGKLQLHGLGLPADRAAAAAAFDKACALDPWSCSGKAALLAAGGSNAGQGSAVAALLSKACTAGNASSGCRTLGDGLAAGQFGRPDAAAATSAFDAGCAAGDPVCCTSLGERYASGQGAPRQDDKAVALFDRACAAGDPVACVRLARHRDEGLGTQKDPAAAVRALGPACELGSASACLDLGRHYELGSGVLADLARAAALYQDACDRGLVAGCTHWALALIHGAGVARDPRRGLDLVEKGCDARDIEACTLLGWLLDAGPAGIARDPGRSVTLLKAACDAGSADACGLRGAQLAKGGQGGADLATAAQLISRACAAGRAESCLDLAVLHAEGRGVPRDTKRALELFDAGCRAGEARGCQQAAQLRGLRTAKPAGASVPARTERLRLPVNAAEVRLPPGHGWQLAAAGAAGQDLVRHPAAGLELVVVPGSAEQADLCVVVMRKLAGPAHAELRPLATRVSGWADQIMESGGPGGVQLTYCQDDGFWDEFHVVRLATLRTIDGHAPTATDLDRVRIFLEGM